MKRKEPRKQNSMSTLSFGQDSSFPAGSGCGTAHENVTVMFGKEGSEGRVHGPRMDERVSE